MGQLDPTPNPTQPATRLTRDPIDPTQTRPDPPVLPCLVERVEIVIEKETKAAQGKSHTRKGRERSKED